jgi:hypothetical protein
MDRNRSYSQLHRRRILQAIASSSQHKKQTRKHLGDQSPNECIMDIIMGIAVMGHITTATDMDTAGVEDEVFAAVEGAEGVAARLIHQTYQNSARQSGRSLVGQEAKSHPMASTIPRTITTMKKHLINALEPQVPQA